MITNMQWQQIGLRVKNQSETFTNNMMYILTKLEVDIKPLKPKQTFKKVDNSISPRIEI